MHAPAILPAEHFSDLPADLAQPVRDALLTLYRQGLDRDEPAIHALAIELAVAATGSEIGYFHLVNDDQETIELGTWSQGTLQRCQAVYERHYPLSVAGVWADCARERRPLIHNDYPGLRQKRGYPEGHVPLQRHLGVPVIADGKVVLLVGVGNKPADYDEGDMLALQVLAEHAWRLIARSRRLHALADGEQQFADLRRLAAFSLWEWDPEERTLVVDAEMNRLFRVTPAADWRWDLESLLRFIETGDHPQLLDLFRSPPDNACFDLQLRAVRADGSPAILHLRGNVCPRSQGHGRIVRGVMQDISERLEAEQARFQASHDPLTGLANRSRLMHQLTERLSNGRRRPADRFALHFIDLDRFKPVNDTYGHAVGDEVLRLVAQRLLRLTRKDDLVARIGGDELVIVQQHVGDLVAAESLAAKLVAALEAPMTIGAHRIQIGASIGIVLAEAGEFTPAGLLAAADAAMYRVKQRGRGGYGT